MFVLKNKTVHTKKYECRLKLFLTYCFSCVLYNIFETLSLMLYSNEWPIKSVQHRKIVK